MTCVCYLLSTANRWNKVLMTTYLRFSPRLFPAWWWMCRYWTWGRSGGAVAPSATSAARSALPAGSTGTAATPASRHHSPQATWRSDRRTSRTWWPADLSKGLCRLEIQPFRVNNSAAAGLCHSLASPCRYKMMLGYWCSCWWLTSDGLVAKLFPQTSQIKVSLAMAWIFRCLATLDFSPNVLSHTVHWCVGMFHLVQ